MNQKYESPEITVISMELDESLMALGGDIGGTVPSLGQGVEIMPGSGE